MEQVKFLPLLIICVQTAKGFIWNSNTTSSPVCVGNTISLNWAYTLESGEFPQGTSWTKSDGAGEPVFLAKYLVGFSPEPAYVGRLTSIGNAGIQISNATSSDKGTYSVCVALTSGRIYKMDAIVHVHEIANASCIPTCDSSWKCQIPQACPVQNYIDAVWTVDGVKYPNVFQCSPNNFNKPYNVCAEGDAVTSCYREPSLCLKEYPCIGKQCQLPESQLVLAFGLFFGLGIPILFTLIVVIFIYTAEYLKPKQTAEYRKPKQTVCTYVHGLAHGFGIGCTFQVGWIIIVSLISTGTISCKLELGLALGLSSGMACVITFIIAAIFIFKGSHSRGNIGKGILTGLLIATVIGIIVVYLKPEYLKPKQTGVELEDNPPKPDGNKHEQVPLKPIVPRDNTENSGGNFIQVKKSDIKMSRKSIRVIRVRR